MLIFEQSGFAQVAGQLDISGYFSGLSSVLSLNKFRPLHLRYLSYNNLNDSFKLLLDKGDSQDLKEASLKDSTKELLNYFFTGITLPNDSFWVNLRPDSPDNIIDDYLAQTEVGRILLEADVQLKKDTAAYTSPQTPEGKAYWDKLYKKAEELLGQSNITIPTLVRPWIVPDEIIIREAKDNAYIYKATLKVLLEDDYLKSSSTYNFQDPRLKALNEYSGQLIKEKIIPKLIKEVNTSKKYASLRQVYYSLILAQWFKARFHGKGGSYSSLIDKKDLTGLISTGNWSKQQYFQQYQNSFKDGEYNLKEKVYSPYGQLVRTYTSGGINISNLGISSSPVAPGESYTDGRVTTIGSSKPLGLLESSLIVAMFVAGSLILTGQVAAQNTQLQGRIKTGLVEIKKEIGTILSWNIETEKPSEYQLRQIVEMRDRIANEVEQNKLLNTTKLLQLINASIDSNFEGGQNTVYLKDAFAEAEGNKAKGTFDCDSRAMMIMAVLEKLGYSNSTVSMCTLEGHMVLWIKKENKFLELTNNEIRELSAEEKLQLNLIDSVQKYLSHLLSNEATDLALKSGRSKEKLEESAKKFEESIKLDSGNITACLNYIYTLGGKLTSIDQQEIDAIWQIERNGEKPGALQEIKAERQRVINQTKAVYRGLFTTLARRYKELAPPILINTSNNNPEMAGLNNKLKAAKLQDKQDPYAAYLSEKFDKYANFLYFKAEDYAGAIEAWQSVLDKAGNSLDEIDANGVRIYMTKAMFNAGEYKQFISQAPRFISGISKFAPFQRDIDELEAMLLAARIISGEIKINESNVKDFCKQYGDDPFLSPFINGQEHWNMRYMTPVETIKSWDGFKQMMELIKQAQGESIKPVTGSSPVTIRSVDYSSADSKSDKEMFIKIHGNNGIFVPTGTWSFVDLSMTDPVLKTNGAANCLAMFLVDEEGKQGFMGHYPYIGSKYSDKDLNVDFYKFIEEVEKITNVNTKYTLYLFGGSPLQYKGNTMQEAKEEARKAKEAVIKAFNDALGKRIDNLVDKTVSGEEEVNNPTGSEVLDWLIADIKNKEITYHYASSPVEGLRDASPIQQQETNKVELSVSASSPVLGKWAQKMIFGMLTLALPIFAMTDSSALSYQQSNSLVKSINQGEGGSLERVLMLSVDDSLITSKVLPNIDYEGLAVKSAQGNGEAFLQLLTLYRYVGEYGSWGKFVSDTIPGYLKSKIRNININVFKDEAINGDCFAIEALYILAKDHRNYDAEGILAGVKLDKLIEKANQGDPQAYVIIGRLVNDSYLPINSKCFSKIDPSALINRYLSGEKNTYFDKAISLYADKYKDGNAKKLAGLLLEEANKGNIEVLNTLVMVATNLEPEDQADILGKKINPARLKGKVNAENIDLVLYIFNSLLRSNNAAALDFLYELAVDYKQAGDFLANFCDFQVLMLRSAHLTQMISSVELERRLMQENMGNNPRFLYLAFSSDEMFGDLAKLAFDKLQNMAVQNKFPDVDSYLRSLDPRNIFYTDFVLQSANFSLLGNMINSSKSLGAITKLLFQDLSPDYMKNYSARFALFVEKTIENKDFKYQEDFQKSLLNLYRSAKDNFHRKFLAVILSLYKEDLNYLDKNTIGVIEENEKVSYQKEDYRIDYKNLFKNDKIIVNLVYGDEDAVISGFGPGGTLSFFTGKGYAIVAKTPNRTTIENASGTVRIVLIDNSRDEYNYDMAKEASEGARIISARNHAGNSGKVYKLLNDTSAVAPGFGDKYKDCYFILGQCRGVTRMSKLNNYTPAGTIAVNGTGFGARTDAVTWKFVENLASRKYPNVFEVSQATIKELPKTIIEDYVLPSNKAGVFDKIVNKITSSASTSSSSPVKATDSFLIDLEIDAIASSISEAIVRSKVSQSRLLAIYMSGVTTGLAKYRNTGLDFNTILNKLNLAMQEQGIGKVEIDQLNRETRKWKGLIEQLALAQKQSRENIGLVNEKLVQHVERLTAGGKEIVIHGTSIDGFLAMLASGQMIQGEANSFGKGNYFEIAKSGNAYAISPDRTEVLLLFDRDSFIKDHSLVSPQDFIDRPYKKDGVVTEYEFFIIKMNLPMYGDYLKYFKLITSAGVSDLKDMVAASSPVEARGRLIRMTTQEGRLNHSLSAIRQLVGKLGGKAVIYDIGVGVDAITTRELANQVKGVATVFGIDSQIPHYSVVSPDGTLMLFDRNDRLIHYEAMQRVATGDKIDSAIKTEAEAFARSLRQKARKSGVPDFTDKTGNKIIMDPMKLQETGNLKIKRGDLFAMNAVVRDEALPNADLVRIANVLIPHFTPNDITRALSSLLPFVNENGYVLIGYTAAVESGREESLVYRKRGSRFVLEGIMLSAEVSDGVLEFGVNFGGWAQTGSMGSGVKSDLLAFLKKNAQYSELLQFRNTGHQPYWDKHKRDADSPDDSTMTDRGNADFDQARRVWAGKVSSIIAEAMHAQGIVAQAEGSMIFLGLKPEGALIPHAGLLEQFKQRYLSQGVPEEVSISSAVSAVSLSGETARTASSPVMPINVFAGNNQFLPKGRTETLKADLNVCLLVVAMDKDGNRFMAHFLPSGHIQGGLSNPDLVKDYFETHLKKMLQNMPNDNVKVAIISSTQDANLRGLLAELEKNGPAPYLITLEGIEGFLKKRGINIPSQQKDNKKYMKTVTFDQEGNVKITYLDTKEAEKERVIRLAEASSASSPVEQNSQKSILELVTEKQRKDLIDRLRKLATGLETYFDANGIIKIGHEIIDAWQGTKVITAKFLRELKEIDLLIKNSAPDIQNKLIPIVQDLRDYVEFSRKRGPYSTDGESASSPITIEQIKSKVVENSEIILTDVLTTIGDKNNRQPRTVWFDYDRRLLTTVFGIENEQLRRQLQESVLDKSISTSERFKDIINGIMSQPGLVFSALDRYIIEVNNLDRLRGESGIATRRQTRIKMLESLKNVLAPLAMVSKINRHILTSRANDRGQIDIKFAPNDLIYVRQALELLPGLDAGILESASILVIQVEPMEGASSPITKDTRGGIDFRSLPIATQPVMNTQLNNIPTPRQLVSVNLDESWGQIQNMLKAEIIPSSERIKEYLQVCCGKKDMNQEIDKVLACIADMLRLQEERVINTDLSLKEMLALLESDKSASEMQFVLAKIIVPESGVLAIAQ